MNQVKRLYRLRDDSRLAGICSGLGEFFAIDPVLIRLGWILVTVFTGLVPGILAYLAAWVIVPEAPRPAPAPQPSPEPHQNNA